MVSIMSFQSPQTPSLITNNPISSTKVIYIFDSAPAHRFFFPRLLHRHLRSGFSSLTSMWLRVSESGRGQPALLCEVLDAVFTLPVSTELISDASVRKSRLSSSSKGPLRWRFGIGLLGRGCCIAKKPEVKHPPYALRASSDAALLKAIACLLASESPSLDPSKSSSNWSSSVMMPDHIGSLSNR
jgi:hypothetical protein